VESGRRLTSSLAIGPLLHELLAALKRHSMSRRTVVFVAVAVLAIAVALWFVRRSSGSGDTNYRFDTIAVGSIQQTVSATGALSAVKTVQVGTQVSGQVAQILADFNDRVTKGQLLARIDPTLQEQAVRDAQAQLEKAQAQLLQAQQEYNRNEPLFKQQFISATEFGTMQVNLSVAQAGVKSAQVALDKGRQNLSYTNIYAPINGVIIERNVDVGQTVAASLSAPQIFLIAQDLAQMQILAAVDESDISSIKGGQAVKFTVQAFPSRTFDGVVQEVRLQSKLADNVVSYTAVVTLDNADSKLLPGMTATVEFITGSATNVLTIANSALRFKPTPEELAASGLPLTTTGGDSSRGGRVAGGGGAGATTTGATTAAGAGAAAPAGGTTAAASSRRATGGSASAGGSLWTLDANKKLKRIRVRVGLSNGQRTQVSGTELAAGLQVIIGSTSATTATPAAASSANPLTPQRGGGRPGGG
jgi:HlyD family secretion protein